MNVTNYMLNEIMTNDGHNGRIVFSSNEKYYSRREGTIDLLRRVGHENVIHVGCCGHLRNIDKQISSGTHFHKNLIENFEKVLGFDIYPEAVEKLASYGVPDVYLCDFVNDAEKVMDIIHSAFGDEPYSILIPEVLEHIPNPVDFLEKVRKAYCGKGNKLIITVPNAYGFGRICEGLFRNSETINMDHKYMFTPSTIMKVMSVAGIIPEEITFFDLYKYSKFFHKPMLGNTIAVIGNIQKI